MANLFVGATMNFLNDWFENNTSLFAKGGTGWYHNNKDGWDRQNAMLNKLFADADGAESAAVEDLKGQAGYAERNQPTVFVGAKSGKVDGNSLRQRVAKYFDNLIKRKITKKNNGRVK